MATRPHAADSETANGTAVSDESAVPNRTAVHHQSVTTDPTVTDGATVTNGHVRRTIVEEPAGLAYQYQQAGQQTSIGTAPNMDRSRWSPIWAGFVTTVGIFLIVETFLIWLGALGITSTGGGGIGINRPWVAWIIAICAFFVGGLVMAMTNPVRGPGANALNGFFVWALVSTVFTAASLLGAGAILGTVGSMISHVSFGGSGAHHVTPSSLSALKSSAGWAFWTLLSTAVAVCLGGFLAGFGRPIGWVEDKFGNYVK